MLSVWGRVGAQEYEAEATLNKQEVAIFQKVFNKIQDDKTNYVPQVAPTPSIVPLPT